MFITRNALQIFIIDKQFINVRNNPNTFICRYPAAGPSISSRRMTAGKSCCSAVALPMEAEISGNDHHMLPITNISLDKLHRFRGKPMCVFFIEDKIGRT